MEIIDARTEMTEEQKNYDAVLAFTDDFFGQGRVSADGRGFVGSRSSVYINMDRNSMASDIEIMLSPSKLGIHIIVNKEECYEEAKRFGESYENRFEGGNVRLTHNRPYQTGR